MKTKNILVVLLIISSLLSGIAVADNLKVGDVIGSVLYTDIVTKINGTEIQSFNINGKTAIYVSDLTKAGLDVSWDPIQRAVFIMSLNQDLPIRQNIPNTDSVINTPVDGDKYLAEKNDFSRKVDSFINKLENNNIALRKDKADVISEFSIRNVNYDEAVKIFDSQIENNLSIINGLKEYKKTIFNIQTNQESAEVARFLNEIESKLITYEYNGLYKNFFKY